MIMRFSTIGHSVALLALATLGLGSLSVATADEQVAEWVAPVITGYGYINPLPEAAFQPDAQAEYKVVFDIAKGESSAHAVNPGLWHVARVVNLFGQEGKPAANLDLVVILHGGATRAVLTDQAYQARFGTQNPNAELLDKLTEAGVKLYVCGQAIVDSGYYYQNIRDGIEVALGALAAEIELGAQGYTVMKL
jgi:intracellular sulfur oxidation DsrE/DsrF family protein